MIDRRQAELIALHHRIVASCEMKLRKWQNEKLMSKMRESFAPKPQINCVLSSVRPVLIYRALHIRDMHIWVQFICSLQLLCYVQVSNLKDTKPAASCENASIA